MFYIFKEDRHLRWFTNVYFLKTSYDTQKKQFLKYAI